MRVLVIGGAGFIGSHFCAKLVTRGIETTAMDAFRFNVHAQGNPEIAAELRFRKVALLSGVHVLHASLGKDALRSIVEKINPDCIIHLAGTALVGEVERYPDLATADIYDSTLNILDTIRKLDIVKRFVFVSSSMVYGDFLSDGLSEISPTKPKSHYGMLKLRSEIATREYLAGTNVETVIVRPSGVYGPGDIHGRVVKVFCDNALQGKQLFINESNDNRIDFTWVGDLVDGLFEACVSAKAAGETFNMTFGHARHLMELIDCVRVHVPSLTFSTRSEDGFMRPRRGSLSIDKARQLLGYSPKVPLESGVSQYIAHRRRMLNMRSNRSVVFRTEYEPFPLTR
jgi:UDP-glucose 4-epimerase